MTLVEGLGVALIAVALVHGGLTLFALWVWPEGRRQTVTAMPPVTVLKPLHGDEPMLEEALRGFFLQHYPSYQIVFGVREAEDAALRVVARLRAEHPTVPVVVVVDPSLHGGNRKVSNLINMLPAALHEWLVLADSDIHVGPDYLSQVVPPLLEERTGIVTCLYRGRSLPNRWSRLGALYISDWFMPSVLLARLLGRRNFAFGATIALRREVLARIGGFEAIRDHLADDYMLSELVRRQGLYTVLSTCVVETTVGETSLPALVRHELRWLRTNRLLAPLGYAFCFLTFTIPLVLAGLWMAGGSSVATALAAGAVGARLMLHWVQRRRGGGRLCSELWLVPLRDLLIAGMWAAGFMSQRVDWGRSRFTVQGDGSLAEIATRKRS